MNRLTQVESSRMIAVLDEAMEKLTLVRAACARVCWRAARGGGSRAAFQLSSADFEVLDDSFVELFDVETQRLLRRQRKCERQLLALAEEEEVSLTEFNRASAAVRESARALVRRLRVSRAAARPSAARRLTPPSPEPQRDPASASLLRSHGGEVGPSPSLVGFVRLMHDLKLETMTKLETTVEAAAARAERAHGLQDRISKAAEDRKHRTAALAEERRARETDVAQLSDIAAKLRGGWLPRRGRGGRGGAAR